jgi:hypothetical protein
MPKLAGFACAAMLLLLFTRPESNKFLRYKSVEAYEVRPGILMMPRYSETGQVCEIGLEKRHYSPERISLDSTLSREEIGQIADELAPAGDRGPKAAGFAGDLISEVGPGITTVATYENLSIEIYSYVLPASKRGRIVADDIAQRSAGRIESASRGISYARTRHNPHKNYVGERAFRPFFASKESRGA